MKLFREHKLPIIIASVLTVLPLLIYTALWNLVEGWITLPSGVDTLRVSMIIINSILILVFATAITVTALDKSGANQNKNVLNMVFFIPPALSIYTNALMISLALGHEISINSILIILGVTFLILGNYMPKCKRNFTIGIKTPYTLANEDNWYATHRFAGKLYFGCGAALLVIFFLPETVALILGGVILVFGIIIPSVLYPYLYYRRQLARGEWTENASDYKMTPKSKAVISAITVPIVIFALLISFVGDIDVELTEETLRVSATFQSATEIDLDDITSAELCEGTVSGSRIIGVASSRLLLGTFTNTELGTYTRYTYTSADATIIVRHKGGILVFTCRDAESTRALYSELNSKIQK